MEPAAYNSYYSNEASLVSGYGVVSQQEVATARDPHGGSFTYPSSSSANMEVSAPPPAPATQEYHYPSYTNPTDPYANSYAHYQNYWYAYAQPPSDASSQQVVTSQSSGAPYQPPYSFQNSGGPASYSGTYNPGDPQTMAGYHGNSFNNHNNMHTEAYSGTYSYNHHQTYPNSDQIPTQNSNGVLGNGIHYQYHQNYSWPSGYTVNNSSFNPVPDNMSGISPCTTGGSVAVSGHATNQPPPPGTTSWRGATGSCTLSSAQVKSENMVHNPNSSWEASAAGLQNQHATTSVQYFQQPNNSNFPLHNSEDQHNNAISQGAILPPPPPPPPNQVPEKLDSPSRTTQVMDTRRTMQIPTNPRISSNFPRIEKEGPMRNASPSPKPAYISVPMSKPTNKVPSNQNTESIIESQQGKMPPTLQAFVSRSFVRCKDDTQRDANAKIIKDIIAQAVDDGTFFTKNWDLEPLFPLPNTTLVKIDQKGPVRRTKSRWEPIPEEKLLDNATPANNQSVATEVNKIKISESPSQADSRKYVPKVNGWNNTVRFVSPQQQNSPSRSFQRPVKKQQLVDKSNIAETSNASSDSDKEQSLTKYYSSAIALANSPEEKKKRENRFRRFEKVQAHHVEAKIHSPIFPGSTKRPTAPTARSFDSDNRAVEDMDWDALTVKGTCQEVEKRYLRLTSAPDPSAVRPDYILEKALEMVLLSEKNYLYKCDQLKSIRQDLTVQRIQNELTVKVYEVHARLALEAGDVPEYNQCQSQLKRLYTDGIKGSYMEFSAYHLLCVMQSNNKRELLSSMTRLSVEAKSDVAVRHALSVRRAVASGNYIKFFQLYRAAPNLNTCLMDLYVEKMRFEAVRCMSKSHRPSVPVSYIHQVLGFSKKGQEFEWEGKCAEGLAQCEDWLRAHGASLTTDNGELIVDTKATLSSLFMPDPDDAVAHGDASLAVDDFLARS